MRGIERENADLMKITSPLNKQKKTHKVRRQLIKWGGN